MMYPKGTLRFALYCGYLVALFGFMLWVYTSLTRFDALMRLEVGQSEHLIFAPASEPSPFSVRMAMPAELHPFMIPSTPRRLSRDQDFSTQPLPFQVSLAGVEVIKKYPPQDKIIVRGANEEGVTIVEGDTLSLPGGRSFSVVELGPWQGLVPSTRGVPSAAVLLISPEGEEQVILMEDRKWVFPSPQVAMKLRWPLDVDTKKSGSLVIDDAVMDDGGWWTVVDGDSEIRINQLVPGAGIECADGSIWTIEGRQKQEFGYVTGLHLRVEENGKSRFVEVSANASDPSGRVHFYNPHVTDIRIFINAITDNRVSVEIDTDKLTLYPEDMIRKPIPLPNGGELRVLQALAYGLPALESSAPIQQAVLQAEDGARWYLREGSVEDVDGLSLLYRREEPAPKVRLQLATQAPNQAETQNFVLAPDDSHRIGTWRFSLAPPIPGDEQGHLLHVRFVAFTPDRLLGIALFIGGAFGLVWIRFRPRIKHDGEGELDND